MENRIIFGAINNGAEARRQVRRRVGGAFQAEELPWTKAMRWEVTQENREWNKGRSGWDAGRREMMKTRQAAYGQAMLGIIDLPKESALSPKSNASPFFSTLVAFKQILFAQPSQCSAPKTGHTPRWKSCRHNLGLSRWI